MISVFYFSQILRQSKNDLKSFFLLQFRQKSSCHLSNELDLVVEVCCADAGARVHQEDDVGFPVPAPTARVVRAAAVAPVAPQPGDAGLQHLAQSLHLGGPSLGAQAAKLVLCKKKRPSDFNFLHYYLENSRYCTAMSCLYRNFFSPFPQSPVSAQEDATPIMHLLFPNPLPFPT